MVKSKLRILCLVLLAICLAGCAFDKKDNGNDMIVTESRNNEQAEENGKDEDSMIETEQNVQRNMPDATAIDDSEETANENGKILVAYFSATGTTKKLAEYAAEVMDADLYEIVPEEPYTDADLNWNDKKSRTSIEMNDKSIKPAINGSVKDMTQYDIVFIGYPIWWGDAPHIMDTFMDSYDFSGKTIVPFCTSGGSGIGSSARNLHDYTDSSVTWFDGARLNSGSSKEDMADWIRGLSLGIEVK